MLATLIQRYDNKSFHFYPVQEWETNWNFTGCQVPHFMSIYQSIESFLDNEMSVLGGIWSFKIAYICCTRLITLNFLLLGIPLNMQSGYVQSNFNGSNTDGSFTMAYSNSFLSPYGIFPIAQENKYWGKFSYFIMKLYVVCTHKNRLIEAVLMSTHNIPLFCWRSETFPFFGICFPTWCHALISLARTTRRSSKLS